MENGLTLRFNKVYTVANTKMVGTQDGESMVLNLLNHLKDRLKRGDSYVTPPFYVRPRGLKPCRKNPKNKYHSYDLVVPN